MSSPLAVVDHFATCTRHHTIALASGLSLNLIECDAPPAHSHAPTVLLLHGLADAAVVWHNVAEELRTEARVLAPDLRGHGIPLGAQMPTTGSPLSQRTSPN